MMAALLAFQQMAEGGTVVGAGAPLAGMAGLLDRLRAVYPLDKAEDCGRLPALTLLGGNPAGIGAMLALVGRRCAN